MHKKIHQPAVLKLGWWMAFLLLFNYNSIIIVRYFLVFFIRVFSFER